MAKTEPEHAPCILTLAYARELIEPAPVARLLDAVRAALAAQTPLVLIDQVEHRRSRPGESFGHTIVRVWDLSGEQPNNHPMPVGR